jgi:hypothetical protein
MANATFDPTAFFLLDLQWENLFEPANAAERGFSETFRCKGCTQIVARRERKKHHQHHKRVEHNRRARLLQENREKALAKARKARARRKEEDE